MPKQQECILAGCQAWVRPSTYVSRERPCGVKQGLASEQGLILCGIHLRQLRSTGSIYRGPK